MKNKLSNLFVLIAGLIFLPFLSGCEDDPDGDGFVQVTVKNGDDRLRQAVVYMRKDIIINNATYIDSLPSYRTDASGELSMEDVKPGKYYLFAKGKNLQHLNVSGIDSVMVLQCFRENDYSVVIQTQSDNQ